MQDRLTARRSTGGVAIVALLMIIALLFWTIRHVQGLVEMSHHQGQKYGGIFFIAFCLLVWQMSLALLERPFKVTAAQQDELDKGYLVINVPCYNEDPAALKTCLDSMFHQTRMIDLIHVVDDGSTISYEAEEAWLHEMGRRHQVETRWDRQPNAGKRHAQGRTIAATPQADFYITIDSDAILDEHAIEEGLKPFADPRVQSVAGVILIVNWKTNLITRISELWFVVGQMIDRSAMSVMGGVLVNSGALAFYRGDLLREHLDGYLHESFFGAPVELSDDSMLTIYALTCGRAVQQPTAFAFTLMPEKYSHHRRQYIRWMRGAFIRSFWRFKYLPLSSYAYWTHALGWLQMVLASCTFVIFFLYTPFVDSSVVPYLLLIPLLVGMGQGLRYFSVVRSDMGRRQALGIYLLTPISCLYSFFILRFIRLYAIATCRNTGWGTRQTVELTLEAIDAA